MHIGNLESDVLVSTRENVPQASSDSLRVPPNLAKILQNDAMLPPKKSKKTINQNGLKTDSKISLPIKEKEDEH